MVKNVNVFPNLNTTSSNLVLSTNLWCSVYCQRGEIKQKIFTFKKLESEKFDFLKNKNKQNMRDPDNPVFGPDVKTAEN